MRQYFLNFFVWWYGVRVRHFGEQIYDASIFILEYTNTLVMARNLSTPLFQDETRIGKAIGFVIRAIWVWVGGTLSMVVILPLLLLLAVVALLPLLAILEIIFGLMQIFV